MALWYTNALKRISENVTDIGTGGSTLKIMLVGTGYTPDRDHTAVSTASAYEISCTGYTPGYGNSGRHTLAGQDVTYSTSTDIMKWDATDETWTSLGTGATIRYAIIIQELSGDDPSSFLICCCQAAADIVTNGGNVTVQWDTGGIAEINNAP